MRRFARVVAGENRRPGGVPLIGKIKTAFLDPAGKILRRNLVRKIQDRMIRGENTDLRGGCDCTPMFDPVDQSCTAVF